jgi:mono/diheme cytochrome c family protein
MIMPVKFVFLSPRKSGFWRALSLSILLVFAVGTDPLRAETVSLDRIEHIHGLTTHPEHPEQLYLATHSGLFLASPNGTASRVGDSQDDLMSFAADPQNPQTFYASGHPPGGGNLGFLTSRDGGMSWENTATGAGGPVDFHAMDVSGADPKVIYGMYGNLQVSRDGGRAWRIVGPLPKDTFDLAASAQDPDRIYVAARGGLFESRDGGKSWTPATLWRQPATLVYSAEGGRIYAFVYGVGLLTTDKSGSDWELRSDRFNDRYLLHMAADPANTEVLHAIVDTGAIVTSKDGGRTWSSYEGHDKNGTEQTTTGSKLYATLCQSCHGAGGVGERPKDQQNIDEYGFLAPALNDSAHAWHHSDGDLARTILNGSPRNPRMLPFKELINQDDAESLVTYIKSLWSFRSLACQGTRHMGCMRH